MPGTLHQGILALFQEDPWLAFDILGVARPVGGTPIAGRAEIERDGKEPLSIRPGYPDLVLVHHGYFWKGEDARIVGMKKRRLKFLLEKDISLAGYHLLPSVRADLLSKLGRNAEARQEWRRAAGLTDNARERDMLLTRAAAL